MATLHKLNETDSGLRTTMSVAATLCVLGLATLVWLHDSPQISVAAQPAPFVAVDSPAAGPPGRPVARHAFASPEACSRWTPS